jgi:hypothetical protein
MIKFSSEAVMDKVQSGLTPLPSSHQDNPKFDWSTCWPHSQQIEKFDKACIFSIIFVL